MYAFRKPISAGTFVDVEVWDVGYKTALIVSQTLGYTLSKFLGIKFVSELPPQRRAMGILMLIAIAHGSLLFFALVPPPWGLIFIFINGLPLGMVFGLVLGFLEGRKVTELLAAGLCASFILASGVVKSVGQALIVYAGVTEYWMPFLSGTIFILPLLLATWLLAQIPPPTRVDMALRSQRAPMTRDDRRRVFRKHALGLVLLVTVFLFLTVLRSLRDDFAVEIWAEMGTSQQPSIFTVSEMIVMLGVVAINGAAFLINDNRRAFFSALGTVAAGFLSIACAAIAFEYKLISGFGFMIAVGIGTYVPYVAFHTTVFERLIATFKERANLSFLMYLADSFGYLGYVGILLFRSFSFANVSYVQLLRVSSLWIGLVATILMLFAIFYFARQLGQYEPVLTARTEGLAVDVE